MELIENLIDSLNTYATVVITGLLCFASRVFLQRKKKEIRFAMWDNFHIVFLTFIVLISLYLLETS